MSIDVRDARAGAARPVAPAGRGPAEHELRGRQHVGEGHGDRPRHGRARRAAVGQGLGRRPRDADRGRAVRAPARPAARAASTCTRASSARTRWSRRSTTACTAGAAPRPSIDTAMHGLVDAAHVDHLHPDSGIALATAADGEALTRRVLRRPRRLGPVAPPRVPARPRHRRDPAGQPGRDRRGPRRPRDHGLGRHLGGLRGELARDHPDGRAVHRGARPARAVRPADAGLRAAPAGRAPGARRGLLPVVRGLASTDRPQVGHFTDSDVVLDFLAREAHPRLAALGTSCPDHFLRTKVRPLVVDLPPDAPLEDVVARLRELHAAYRDEYRAYYERHATPD